MLAAREKYLQENGDAIRRMLVGLHEAVEIFHSEADMVNKVATNYGLKEEDAKE